jgi:hypothetical protein
MTQKHSGCSRRISATSLEHEDIILQKLTDAILQPAKLTWEAAVESAMLEQPLTGARRGVGTASLTWRVLRAFLRCYDNPHGKDEMEQRLVNWKWAKTIPETQASFNEMVHIWTQAAQQTAALDFDRQVGIPTQHGILEQIVRKMPPWAKKHMQEHPSKYPSVPQFWVALKEEKASYMTRQPTGNIPVLTTIPHDRETRTSILTMTETILAEEAEHVDAASPVALGYGDADDHRYRKCNAPASLEELAGQHASTWPRVTPVVGNMPGTPPITFASSMSGVGSTATPYPRPVSDASGARAVGASTVQRGPLQALARSMFDLQYRVTGLEREPSPAPSLSSVDVLGGDAIGRGASFRLDHHRGSRCHGAT